MSKGVGISSYLVKEPAFLNFIFSTLQNKNAVLMKEEVK